MVLPDDFNWSPDNPHALPEDLEEFTPVALMDGGISDNQGVGSVRLADRGKAVTLDLIIISDTDRAEDELFAPGPGWRHSGARLWMVCLLAAVAVTLLAISGVRLRSPSITNLR